MGGLYEGKIMKNWGRTSLLIGSYPEPIPTLCPPPPPTPWNLETFPFLLLIIIIHSHFLAVIHCSNVTNFVSKLPIFSNAVGWCHALLLVLPTPHKAPKTTPTDLNTFQNMFF